MKQAENFLRDYLKRRYVMQLATASGSKPWVCSVYYVADDKLNLYWASWPTRRHSREIAACSDVSITVAVEQEKDQAVIGIQAEGRAKRLDRPQQIRPVAKRYAEAFGRDQQWVEDFSNLKTKHRLYKFTPDKYLLFDERSFPKEPGKEIIVGG